MSTLASVFGYGLLSARPAAAVAGRFYYATDTTLMYRDNGATWDTLAVGAGSMATDGLWDAAGDLAVGTGADTAAKLAKGSAGGALSIINAAVAWNSGTSFPGSKATGDRYWRTDLGMEAYWDGTRWLSTQIFDSTPTVNDTSMTTGGFSVTSVPAIWTPWATTYDLYIVRFDGTLRVDASNSGNTGSHFWTVTLQVGTSANSYSNLSGATMTTSAIAADTNTAFTSSPNQLWTPGTNPIGRTLATKTGTPGKLVYCVNAIRYRLVLT